MSTVTRPSSRAEFKIAILCPLPLEAEVVKPFFDPVYDASCHSEYGKVSGDPNSYTLGRIGPYNVILVHMPNSGKAIASSVASHIKLSYPGIELAFLIGVCGGVPFVGESEATRGRRDIFLGDVIISNGVVQYDLGKRLPRGFVRKDTLEANLGRPSHEIRSFLSKIKVWQDRLEDRQRDYLATIQAAMNVPYPGAQKDVLFSPEYSHKARNCQCVLNASSGESVVARRQNSATPPFVHFGLIASGDELMTSAKERDRIAGRERILGFEMEGAGIWDNLPCILVKGVSDYADSHKNKEWQYFAAASAAACMRALLDETPISTAPSLTRPGQDPDILLRTNQRKRPAEVLNHLDKAQEKIYLDLLTFPRAHFRLEEIPAAHEKTCMWVVERPEYQSWMNMNDLAHHGGFFWIKAKPGAGKSTLMKYLFLNAKENEASAIILSFFFHAQGVDLERSTIGMYRSLLHQLLASKAISSDTKQSYFDIAADMQNDGGIVTWSIRDLKNMLLSTIRSLVSHSVLLLIDALDECDQDEIGDMIVFLQQLGDSANTSGVHLRICLASRHYPHINIERGIELVLEDQQEHQHDMKKYVETKLRGGRSKKVQEIREEICQRAGGVFLWVKLVVRSLNETFDAGKIHALRQRLNEIPNELDDLFTDILMRDSKDITDLIFCLQLILFSQRPLSREELYFAVMFTISELVRREIEEHTDSIIGRFILNVSKGLVEITRSKAHTVHFIHESVRDFFLRRDGFNKLQAGLGDRAVGKSHDRLVEVCFKYLHHINQEKFKSMFDELRILPRTSKNKFIKENIPFLDYAVHNLLYHSNAAQAVGASQTVFLQTFPSEFQVFKDAHNAVEGYQSRRYKLNVTLLYILAERNLDHLIQLELLNTSYDWKDVGKYHSPMGAAVYAGNIAAIRALLGCNISGNDSHNDALLEPEVINGMKQYLVDSQRSRLRSNKSMAMFLLTYAIERQHLAILKLLLRTGEIDLNQSLNNGYSPLAWAVKCGNVDVLKVLLDPGEVNVNSRPIRGSIALIIAIREGKRDIIDTLLDHSFIPDDEDSDGKSAVHWAVLEDDEATLRRLIELGCNVAHRDKENRDALSHAAEHSQHDLMSILIDSGMMEIDGKDINGRTPFSWAAGSSWTSSWLLSDNPPPYWDELERHTFHVLLNTGQVDVNSKDEEQMTPLLRAIERGNKVAVEVILKASGCEIDPKWLNGQTPLSVAASRGDRDIINMLLQTGQVDVNSQDINGRTPLSWAVGPCWPRARMKGYNFRSSRKLDAIKALLDCHMIDPSIQDFFSHSPMWWTRVYRLVTEKFFGRDILKDDPHTTIIELLADHILNQNGSNFNAVLTTDDDTLWRELKEVAASYNFLGSGWLVY